MTLGQNRVRAAFNPSGSSLIDDIKTHTAELIDICADHKNDTAGTAEQARLWSLAMTAYEEAAMWAVKAATGS